MNEVHCELWNKKKCTFIGKKTLNLLSDSQSQLFSNAFSFPFNYIIVNIYIFLQIKKGVCSTLTHPSISAVREIEECYLSSSLSHSPGLYMALVNHVKHLVYFYILFKTVNNTNFFLHLVLICHMLIFKLICNMFSVSIIIHFEKHRSTLCI